MLFAPRWSYFLRKANMCVFGRCLPCVFVLLSEYIYTHTHTHRTWCRQIDGPIVRKEEKFRIERRGRQTLETGALTEASGQIGSGPTNFN